MKLRPLFGLLATLLVAAPAMAQSTLKIVMHSDLKVIDPIWATTSAWAAAGSAAIASMAAARPSMMAATVSGCWPRNSVRTSR